MTGKDLGLTIERQMITILGHQHLGQQSLGCHATGQRPLRCGCLHHGALAAAATVAWAADHLDLVDPHGSSPWAEGPRDDVEHLGDIFADHMHRAAAARAALVIDIDDHLDPRRMRRQGPSVALRRISLARSPACRLPV